MRQHKLSICLACLALAAVAMSLNPAQGAAGQTLSPAPANKLTDSDVVDMTKAGLSVDVILAKLQGSPNSFDTSPSALTALKSAGVPDAVILAMVKSSNETTSKEDPAPPVSREPPPAPGVSGKPVKAEDESPSQGCMAVKPIGSHAFRNIMLAGVAGALISKQQYQVVDVVKYPARVGQKFHGNDLQTIRSGGTKVVILDKHYTGDDLRQACR
jgi:hypothetical protein